MELLKREAQREVVQNALSRVRQGRGTTILVSGEAGVGKTSFVSNGGQIWTCGACAKPRGIGESDLIPGARIVSAANAVEYLASGAASLSF